MVAGYPHISIYDIHIALAQTGVSAFGVGQIIMAPTATDENVRYFSLCTVKVFRPRYVFLKWDDGEESEMSQFAREWCYSVSG